ncbi:MAG: helix-turn-helix domain-containing protein [Eggerthellaceae bacterium]|nr:helix-turn-helix domain-containing protein [Eggerthellaceae bacterium]
MSPASSSEPQRFTAGGGFVVVHEFMWRDLGLSGSALLVYARAFGFCRGGGLFYESKPHLAEFLGMSERTVFRAVSELVERGCLVEVGELDLGHERFVKAYDVDRGSLPAGALRPPPDKLAGGVMRGDNLPGGGGFRSDTSSAPPLTDCHPIRKEDNKAYG